MRCAVKTSNRPRAPEKEKSLSPPNVPRLSFSFSQAQPCILTGEWKRERKKSKSNTIERHPLVKRADEFGPRRKAALQRLDRCSNPEKRQPGELTPRWRNWPNGKLLVRPPLVHFLWFPNHDALVTDESLARKKSRAEGESGVRERNRYRVYVWHIGREEKEKHFHCSGRRI